MAIEDNIENIEKISREDAPVVVGLTFGLNLKELVKFCRPVLQHIKPLKQKYESIKEVSEKYNKPIQDLMCLASEYFFLILEKCYERKFERVDTLYKRYITEFSGFFMVPEEAVNWRDKYSEYVQEKWERNKSKKENN